MTDILSRKAEEMFGIKSDPDDIEKLNKYIIDTYGGEDQNIIDKVFSSGEVMGFLTVNETYFFREPAHFSLLWDILPSFEKTGVQICCAAVATGCEAYSVAMMIEAFNKIAEKPLPYHIDAFDINHKVIETACKGVYSGRVLREDGSCFRYMTEPYLKKNENEYVIEAPLKKNIRFFVHNLMDEIFSDTYDLIFFRNAFIYFSPKNRGKILINLSNILKEGGILLMGVSETAGAHNACSEAGFEEKYRKDVFYFQKKSHASNALFTEKELRNKIEPVSS
jgi:chemotaxis protein methyltransferase CheR